MTDGISSWQVDSDEWMPHFSDGSREQQQFSISLDLVDYEANPPLDDALFEPRIDADSGKEQVQGNPQN